MEWYEDLGIESRAIKAIKQCKEIECDGKIYYNFQFFTENLREEGIILPSEEILDLPYTQRLEWWPWKRVIVPYINGRDKKCRLCDNDCRLQVHHADYSYYTLPWDYYEDNFWLLCDGCHEEISAFKMFDTTLILREREEEYRIKKLKGISYANQNTLKKFTNYHPKTEEEIMELLGN